MCDVTEISAKEAKWVLEQSEREELIKEVSEKKIEAKFLDADIQTKRNIIKELEEREAQLKKPLSPQEQNSEMERMQKQMSYFENEVRKLEAKLA